MELKAYFSNINNAVISHLSAAHFEIAVAVAWFTDRDIFEVLCKKAGLGVKVSVVMIGDEINQGAGGLNFSRLRSLGGQVIFLPPGVGDDRIMHHKFCVIDSNTVITGSYNWSRKAKSNDENITVVTDSDDFASDYLDAFAGLLTRVGHEGGVAPVVDTEAVRRRIELIRSLVMLGEQGEIAPHIRKLRPATKVLGLDRLIAALDEGKYKVALELIDNYLRASTALLVTDQADTASLRFELSVLELRLLSMSDEKAELERRLIAFSRRHDEALGEVIQRLLLARAELARLAAREQKNTMARATADAAARAAEEAYADYSSQHEELQNKAPLPSLDVHDEQELKSLYRKACHLCHPDKFPKEHQEAAHRTFTELQAAYKHNDLAVIREILAMLEAGGLPGARSSTMTEADKLKAAIAEVEGAVARIVTELRALHQSDACRLLELAGATEIDWQKFFERQRPKLEAELMEFELRIHVEQEV